MRAYSIYPITLFVFLCLSLPAFSAEKVNHTDFIKGPFDSGQAVTKKCLECHEDAAKQIMETPHWTWQREMTLNGKKVALGKINSINNFCTSTPSNRVHCSECHIGYGWEDPSFDFNDPTNVDCLVCHDNTGTYHKDGDNAGHPMKDVDLTKVAQNVGLPLRENCGSCHFYGGGGDAVKHGDLDSSLNYPEEQLDVHMSVEGNDFRCQECHQTENHHISGANLATSPDGEGVFECTRCHDPSPHEQSRLNAHADTVACQSCHIPVFAKELKTQMDWDWSTAGKDNVLIASDRPNKTYRKTMGTLTWAKDVVPTYAWFNGKATVYLRGEKMDPSKPTALAIPEGSRKDKNAKIHPFKVHSGKQPYDKENNVLLIFHTYGKDGFWSTFDWEKSIRIGMEAVDMPYSGKYAFAPTEMYWRTDHMVSPKEEALGCLDCHGEPSRLDWKKLGYQGDPMTNPEWARTR